jgi:hypothetical protein
MPAPSPPPPIGTDIRPRNPCLQPSPPHAARGQARGGGRGRRAALCCQKARLRVSTRAGCWRARCERMQSGIHRGRAGWERGDGRAVGGSGGGGVWGLISHLLEIHLFHRVSQVWPHPGDAPAEHVAHQCRGFRARLPRPLRRRLHPVPACTRDRGGGAGGRGGHGVDRARGPEGRG